ncbi:transcriptional regulator, TetR family [Desulfotomaculum nigrificans CO-1-SRB]|uniref:Transcriptional regulator, TetR family n=1 Tax=Desulfotomaculum nigrificans (strain DSM 14880 / VKM B-2319 / CO-1-SRB) TaxID=868595 RepID=F6B2Y7_DESCC|nr:TetR/AcrR family transcriptional regulator [Desulfotomaculum nigrificans]AEF95095.1 transcriptional regulator, TetR family [Desulfotomaculum nigrificans CO-1-SRB]
MTVNRRQQIIDAATRCFALFGYKATTMDQVAKLAEVGKGTIYTFFKNKEELFDQIMQDLILEMKEVAEQAVDPNRSFFANLHHVLYRGLDFRRKHELTIKLSQEVKAIGTKVAQAGMKKLEDAILSFIQKEVQQAIDKGEIKKCDPKITAFVMLKLYVALVYDWEKTHPPLDKEQIDNLFRLYLVEGLAP